MLCTFSLRVRSYASASLPSPLGVAYRIIWLARSQVLCARTDSASFITAGIQTLPASHA